MCVVSGRIEIGEHVLDDGDVAHITTDGPTKSAHATARADSEVLIWAMDSAIAA